MGIWIWTEIQSFHLAEEHIWKKVALFVYDLVYWGSCLVLKRNEKYPFLEKTHEKQLTYPQNYAFASSRENVPASTDWVDKKAMVKKE